MTKELFSSLQQTPAIGKATLFDSLQAKKLEKTATYPLLYDGTFLLLCFSPS